VEYDVFISYRRDTGAAEARLLRQSLMDRGLRVFLDVIDLRKGYFDDELLRRISAAPNFVPVLTPGSLDRCAESTDWLRQEIAHAIRERKNIVPVMIGDFSFPAKLPEDIANLPRHQGVAYSHQYFDAMMQTIMEGLVLGEADGQQQPPETPRAQDRAKLAAPLHWSYDLVGGAGLGLVGGLINLALLASKSSIDAPGVMTVCGIIPGAAAALVARRSRGFLPRAIVGAIAGAVAVALVFVVNLLALGGDIADFNRHLPFYLGPGNEHIMFGEAFMLAIPLGAVPGALVGIAREIVQRTLTR
jgi:hypothetical protein